jgi:hypothetical protein
MADHITHDPAYAAVDRDDFPAMIQVERYAKRSDAFDEISRSPSITSGTPTIQPTSISTRTGRSTARP